MISEPQFIGMKYVAEGKENPEGDDDKIYLFFSETAMEYDSYNKLDVSRVARVCKVLSPSHTTAFLTVHATALGQLNMLGGEH